MIFKFAAYIIPPLAVPFDYMLMSPSLHVINCVVGEGSPAETSGMNRLVGVGERKSCRFSYTHTDKILWDFTNIYGEDLYSVSAAEEL